MKRGYVFLLAGIVIAAAAVAVTRGGPEPSAVASTASDSQPESAGLCPWRTPKEDMAKFFPTGTSYDQRILVLSDLRSEVVKRLGPHTPIDANGIYYYRIMNGAERVGGVIAQRTAGEYGVVEYVEAFDAAGKIAGVRIQRIREPESTTKALTSSTWLASFNGRDQDSGFTLGSDIPAVPENAKATAQPLVDSIRRLTIEYDVALAHGR